MRVFKKHSPYDYCKTEMLSLDFKSHCLNTFGVETETDELLVLGPFTVRPSRTQRFTEKILTLCPRPELLGNEIISQTNGFNVTL